MVWNRTSTTRSSPSTVARAAAENRTIAPIANANRETATRYRTPPSRMRRLRVPEVERSAVGVQGRQRHQPCEDDPDDAGGRRDQGQDECFRPHGGEPLRHRGEGRADHAGAVQTEEAGDLAGPDG